MVELLPEVQRKMLLVERDAANVEEASKRQDAELYSTELRAAFRIGAASTVDQSTKRNLSSAAKIDIFVFAYWRRLGKTKPEIPSLGPRTRFLSSSIECVDLRRCSKHASTVWWTTDAVPLESFQPSAEGTGRLFVRLCAVCGDECWRDDG
jgi:hypothetical protein